MHVLRSGSLAAAKIWLPARRSRQSPLLGDRAPTLGL